VTAAESGLFVEVLRRIGAGDLELAPGGDSQADPVGDFR